MEKKRRRRPRLGILVGAAFWLVAICAGLFWAYDRKASRLEGVALLARSSWGASRAEGSPERMEKPSRITLHHLGGRTIQDLDRDAAVRSIKAIQADHIRNRGWNDIGYHYVVDRSGRVWEGRPLAQQGAHAGSSGTNEGNIGILLLGNFDLQTPSPAQLSGCGRLVGALRKRFGIPRDQVLSHNEVRCGGGLGPTSCPGKHLASWIEGYRRGDGETVEAPSPPGDPGVKLVKS